jgi:hypothetical protein
LDNILDQEKATDPIHHAVRHLISDLSGLQKAYATARSEILAPSKAEKGGAQ